MRYVENSSSNLVLDFQEQISQGLSEGVSEEEQLQPQTLLKRGNIQVWNFFVIGFGVVEK